MNKKFQRILSAFAVFVFVLGNANYVGASSVRAVVAVPPAFPGAEGFGANSLGGRGGRIFEIENLNDSGAGSLRACVEASGARTCVFRTGGLIVLQSALRIVNPYITIAGQTAPGGGITLKKASGGDVFLTQTHDVIIRYISVRPGAGGENHANQIAKNGAELYNIIIDHNSLSWGVDSNIETWYRVRNATIQWSLISEALNNSTHSKGAHSKGIMIGGYQGSESGGKGSENISVLNNLMAHNAERNPLMQLCGIAQVMNNTTYNPQWTFSHQQLNCLLGESYVNWINNYHKKGPSSTSNSDLKVIPADDGTWSVGKVYVKGNIGPNRSNDTLPETNWVELKSGAPSGVIVASPAPAPAVYSISAMEAYKSVTADGGVGNSRGLNCDGSWYNRRDAIDARVINEVKTGTGKIIDDPSQVGGWIVPAAGVPCADSDHDGMPDMWEQLHGFNPNLPDDSGDNDGDGYTNIEEYFNGNDSPDSSFPLVTSITITNTTPTTGSAVNVDFAVTFSETVTGVDVNDFLLTATGSASDSTVSGFSGSGSLYTVTVSTGLGSGTIRLDLMDNNSIVDASLNPLGGAAAGDGNFTTGEVYTVGRNIASVNFGDQLFHTSNPPVMVTIPNGNETAIHVGTLLGSSKVGTSWNMAQSFFIEDDTCSGVTVASAASCTFKIRFLPWSLGAKSGSITIPSDAPDQPYVVSLTGNSIAGTQLLSNRSFDAYSASTNFPDLWIVTSDTKTNLDGVDDTWAFHGPMSFKFVGDGDMKILSQTINKAGSPGDDFSFNVMTRGMGIPQDSNRWLLQIMFFNDGIMVENRNIPLTTGTFNNIRLTRTYTATTNYTNIMFRIHYGKPSGTAWIDLANLQWAP